VIDSLVLHDTTKEQLLRFIANPSHALLLSGPDGIGKSSVAEALVSTILNIEPGKLATYPHYSKVSAAPNASISIEAIRELQKFLQLKTIGTNPYRRAVLIEHAQGLTTEAQNAYLKLLEEPPADTLLVLTVDSPRSLLPTILSRLQTITITVPGEAALQQLFAASTKDKTVQTQAYFLSGGLPGLLSALLDDGQEHPLLQSVATAKEILQKSTFERLALVDGLSKQKNTVIGVLAALERIAQTGIQGATAKEDATRIKQWHRIRKSTLEARESIERSANAKLVLSDLFLQLP